VQRLRPAREQLGLPVLAHALGRGRAQLELGERGAQIETGAADDDRCPPLGEQSVYLGVGELRVVGDREARVDRKKRDEPVLQARALDAIGNAGEDLQAGVDLQRVGRHRDRAGAAGPDPLGEGDRDVGLADAGRPKERENPCLCRWRHKRQYGRGAGEYRPQR
jgi:hypothetical protein